jgi:MFS family permease
LGKPGNDSLVNIKYTFNIVSDMDAGGGEDGRGQGFVSRLISDTRFIRGNFLLILVGWLLIDFTREMAFTYYPLYIRELGGTASTLGLIGAVATVTEALVKFPGGYIADKYGRKQIIVTMTFMAGVCYLVYAFAPNWQAVMLGAALCSLCMIYTPSHNALVMDSLPEDKRGTGYSLVNLITRASTTPSPLIAGFLLTRYGLMASVRMSFMAVSLAFVTASLLRTHLQETMSDSKPVDAREVVQSFAGAKVFVEGLSVWSSMSASVKALLAIDLLQTVPNVMMNVVFIYFFVDELGITNVQLSYIGTLIGVFLIIFALPVGRIVDKYGRRKPILFGMALVILVIPFVYDADFTRLVLLTPIIGLLNVVMWTSFSAMYADLIPPEHRGKASGSKDFFFLVAVSIGQILGGWIYDNVSHTLNITIYWLSMFPVIALSFLFIRDPEPAETAVDEAQP